MISLLTIIAILLFLLVIQTELGQLLLGLALVLAASAAGVAACVWLAGLLGPA